MKLDIGRRMQKLDKCIVELSLTTKVAGWSGRKGMEPKLNGAFFGINHTLDEDTLCSGY
jgi:hypothetical protein